MTSLKFGLKFDLGVSSSGNGIGDCGGRHRPKSEYVFGFANLKSQVRVMNQNV